MRAPAIGSAGAGCARSVSGRGLVGFAIRYEGPIVASWFPETLQIAGVRATGSAKARRLHLTKRMRLAGCSRGYAICRREACSTHTLVPVERDFGAPKT